jgi:hypothetical protein
MAKPLPTSERNWRGIRELLKELSACGLVVDSIQVLRVDTGCCSASIKKAPTVCNYRDTEIQRLGVSMLPLGILVDVHPTIMSVNISCWAEWYRQRNTTGSNCVIKCLFTRRLYVIGCTADI